MKHAFLIIAHNEFPVLKALLSMLDDERNDIYLHIDRQAVELYRQVSELVFRKANFHLIPQPMKVYWGDISQVEVEFLLFETALANGPYVYYHLLSGTDLPIKTQDYIHEFFHHNKGKEFVGFWLDKRHQRDLERKVFRYYLFTKRMKDKGNLPHAIAAFLRNLTLAIQKIVHYRREETFEFKKGPNWVSITQQFCEYLIQHKKVILKRMRHTLCPDEIFIQTILWNSPFREYAYSMDTPETGNMRKIDWKRGSPYTWKNEDFDELRHSEKLFARKFSSSQNALIAKIQEAYKI